MSSDIVLIEVDDGLVVDPTAEDIELYIQASSAIAVTVTGGAVGPTGATGATGPTGATGAAGAAGVNGSPDTAAQVLAKLITVDGTGSSLDADLLDGNDSAFFATATSNALKAPLASPALTGTPTAPTATAATNTTQLATTAFATTADNFKANIASPTLTGTPAAPTAAVDTNTTQLATTAMVLAQAASATPLIDGVAAVGTSTRFARGDHVHPTDTTRAPLASPTFTGTVTARVGPRVTTITSSATPTPNSDTSDGFTVTAQAAGATFAAPTGTPTEMQKLFVRIKDNGGAQTLAWNGIYRASTDLALPTTTILSKTLYLGFIYNFTDSKWDLVALLNNF